MTVSTGYISSETTVTVAELRAVLAAADDDDAVHVVTDIHAGESVPLRGAMASDGDDHHVYLYTEPTP